MHQSSTFRASRFAVRAAADWLARQLIIVGVAAGSTTAVFLVLPLIQAIGDPPARASEAPSVDVAAIQPPLPPPLEEEPEEEPEPDEKPPELEEDVQPLDLSQLELALEGGSGDGWMNADFSLDLDSATGGGESIDALFSAADLDQKPRAIYQPSPIQSAKTRKKAPGKAVIVFTVNQRGRVEDAAVYRSDDPVFERPALAAVKQWKFEPGKREGEPVKFRMRVPITFPEG